MCGTLIRFASYNADCVLVASFARFKRGSGEDEDRMKERNKK